MKLFLLTISITLFSSNLFALNITCTHPQVCRVIDAFDSESIKTHYPLSHSTGDPHHFEPTTKDLRNLINAEILIAAPLELQPWLRNVIAQRERNSALKTHILSIQELVKMYEGSNSEALGHFWLFPEGLKSSSRSIQNFLTQVKEDIKLKETFNLKINEIEKELNEAIEYYRKNNNQPIIISHDALTPLLSDKEIPYVILRSSGHGERITPRSMKNLEDTIRLVNDGAIYWINEHHILDHSHLRSKIREQDKVLNLKTDGPTPYNKESSSHLEDLLLPIQDFIVFLKS